MGSGDQDGGNKGTAMTAGRLEQGLERGSVAMFKTRICVPLLGVLVLLSAVTLADRRPASAQSSFEGQTIRIAVGTTAGAATDVLARQLAPFISRHLPGKPIVAVENRPGAGGAVAGGYIYNLAKPDGQVVGFLTGAVTQGLIGGENIRFDPAKFGELYT